MLYKHTCSHVLRCALHVIRNNVEKVKLDVGGSSESVFTIERANTTSNAVYKKREFQLKEFTR